MPACGAASGDARELLAEHVFRRRRVTLMTLSYHQSRVAFTDVANARETLRARPTVRARAQNEGVDSPTPFLYCSLPHRLSSPMLMTITEPLLDAVLATQLTIAWAGEARCSPRRLGWWDTDLIDEAGGGDFFGPTPPADARVGLTRSCPIRRAARRREGPREDGEPRQDADAFLSRLRARRAAWGSASPPTSAREAPRRKRSRSPSRSRRNSPRRNSSRRFQGGDVAFTAVPNGRQLKGKLPDAPDAIVQRLSAALVPFADQYPLPFYKLEG